MAEQPEIDGEEYDAEDTAEVLDETNLTEDGEDIANFDELPRVLDVTSAIGDGGEGDGDDDPELFDEDEQFDGEENAGDDSPRTRLEDRPDNEAAITEDSDDEPPVDELVTTEDRTKPNRFESAKLSDGQLEDLGYRRKG
jgi:hypothetical protein